MGVIRDDDAERLERTQDMLPQVARPSRRLERGAPYCFRIHGGTIAQMKVESADASSSLAGRVKRLSARKHTRDIFLKIREQAARSKRSGVVSKTMSQRASGLKTASNTAKTSAETLRAQNSKRTRRDKR